MNNNYLTRHRKLKALRFNEMVPPGQTVPREWREQPAPETTEPPAEKNVVAWEDSEIPQQTKLLLFQLCSLGGEAA